MKLRQKAEASAKENAGGFYEFHREHVKAYKLGYAQAIADAAKFLENKAETEKGDSVLEATEALQIGAAQLRRDGLE